MHKNSINKLIGNTLELSEKANEVLDMLNLIKSLNPKEFPFTLEREQARESAEEAENLAINLLLEINILSQEMVKKIDPEAWKEFKGD